MVPFSGMTEPLETVSSISNGTIVPSAKSLGSSDVTASRLLEVAGLAYATAFAIGSAARPVPPVGVGQAFTLGGTLV
jgi:hypothetical protein